MKKLIYACFLLTVIVLETKAQEKKGFDEDKFNYENLKSILKKLVYPVYYKPPFQGNSVQELLPAMNSGEADQSAVLDFLQKNGTLKIEKEDNEYSLVLDLKFPEFRNASGKTTSTNDSYINHLSKIVKLTLIDCHLQNSLGQELQVNGKNSTIHFGRTIEQTIKKKNGINRVEMNDVTISNPLSDPVQVNSACRGSARYEIKMVTGYDTIRCNKRDVSKRIMLGGNTYKIVSVSDNRVVLEIMPTTKGNIELGVAGFILFHSITIPMKSYDLIRNHPDMTLAEYRKAMSEGTGNQKKQNYLILETFGPLKDDFLIYSPVYGFERFLEMVLKH